MPRPTPTPFGRGSFRVDRRGASIPTVFGPRGGKMRQAGVGATIKIFGVPQAIAKLRAVGAYAMAETALIMAETAKEVEERARDLVPTVTGNLQAGIKAEQVGPFDWRVSASSLEGGADREYAAFVEYGTYKMAPRPYLRPAMSEQRTGTVRRLQALAMRLEAM